MPRERMSHRALSASQATSADDSPSPVSTVDTSVATSEDIVDEVTPQQNDDKQLPYPK
jgi:hypothetical protein